MTAQDILKHILATIRSVPDRTSWFAPSFSGRDTLGITADRCGKIHLLPSACYAVPRSDAGHFTAHFADEGSGRCACGSRHA